MSPEKSIYDIYMTGPNKVSANTTTEGHLIGWGMSEEDYS